MIPELAQAVFAEVPMPTKRFEPPTQDEWCAYAVRHCGMSDKEALMSWLYYDSKGWIVGKVKMARWKSACAGWALRSQLCAMPNVQTHSNYARDMAAQKELERVLARIKSIKSQYDEHRDPDREDRQLLQKLAARRDELRHQLGVKF